MAVLSARQGDITGYDGDAIVNAANNHLQLGAGVAGAIRRVAGPSVQEECNQHGPIRVGEAAITGGGNLTAKYVIHAAAMGDEPVSERSIRESTLASLKLASEHHLTRIAFPVLGTGVGGYDFRRAAEIMHDAVRESPHSADIEEVVFYGYTFEDTVQLEQLLLA